MDHIFKGIKLKLSLYFNDLYDSKCWKNMQKLNWTGKKYFPIHNHKKRPKNISRR